MDARNAQLTLPIEKMLLHIFQQTYFCICFNPVAYVASFLDSNGFTVTCILLQNCFRKKKHINFLKDLKPVLKYL